jgi:hypothetical protein
MKVILSYPRSGNHLVRLFIELLSEQPTLGCVENVKDIPIFMNQFPEEIPFHIESLQKYKEEELYRKFHTIPSEEPSELILIVRNPREVLLRHLENKFRLEGWDGYNSYFNLIDYYNNFKGKKLLLFYEDICRNKIKFVNDLYEFLGFSKGAKRTYAIENLSKLFELSKLGKNRAWGGVNSNSVDYYYNKIKDTDKKKFDNYINDKMNTNKYTAIKEKYNL